MAPSLPNAAMFQIKNAVQVALMQTGVIVAGVLGAGTSFKVWKTVSGLDMVPASITTWMTFGPVALVIPPFWIAAVLILRQRPDVSDDVKSLAFASGIIIIIALTGAVLIAILKPWLAVDFGLGQNQTDP